MIADEFIASPNFGARKNGNSPQYIILHFTVIEEHEEACAFLCDPEREVSAHYVLAKSGYLIQLVDEKDRAWHAGRSFWKNEDDLNSRSIGIEIVNNGAMPFKEAQYQRLIPLIADISARWDIPPQNVLGHSDIAINRKFDPGPWFDWPRLDAAGVSAPPKARTNSDDFRALAASAGYDGDADLEALLLAIRVRHGATPYYGPLRDADFALLAP